MKILLLFGDGTIASGIKAKMDWVKLAGTKNETHGYSYEFLPLGIEAPYDGEPYFENDPIGYIELHEINITTE